MEEQIKDKRNILIPGKSVSIFQLGDNINHYLKLRHDFTSKEKLNSYSDTYFFYDAKVSIWTDEETGEKIDTICCDASCIWNKLELIGLKFIFFQQKFNLIADKKEKLYSYGPKKNGRNYEVYDFDSLGLIVWVWRNKIHTVLVSKPYNEEEESM